MDVVDNAISVSKITKRFQRSSSVSSIEYYIIYEETIHAYSIGSFSVVSSFVRYNKFVN